MQALVQHVSSKQVDENSYASEEHGQPQKIGLKARRKHERSLRERFGFNPVDMLHSPMFKQEVKVAPTVGELSQRVASTVVGSEASAALEVRFARFFDILARVTHSDGTQDLARSRMLFGQASQPVLFAGRQDRVRHKEQRRRKGEQVHPQSTPGKK